MPTPLETWVSDNLLVLLGASDSTTTAYFVTLAQSSPSASALVHTLTQNGLPDSAQTRRFAADLFDRAPRKTSKRAEQNAADARRKADKEKKQLAGAKFSLLLEDDDSAAAGGAQNQAASAKRDKRDKGERARDKVRKRETAIGGKEDAWADEDEEEREIKRRREEDRYAREAARRPRGESEALEERQPVDEEEAVEDEETRRERERLADLAERDAFAARMREKDKDRTKRLVEDRSAKKDPESLLRAKLAADDPDAVKRQMGSLRERSRQSYLGKREQQQLDLLRLEIADWERDFKGVKLTKAEQREYERKKELLRLAEERLAIDEGDDHYQMPDGAHGPSNA